MQNPLESHITPEILEAVLRGDLSPDQLVHRVTDHLSALCPTCRDGVLYFKQARRSEPPSPGLESTLAALKIWNRQLAAAKLEAERELAELLLLPRTERRGRVERARKRFRSPFLAELLLGRAHDRVASDPREAYDLSVLALVVARRLPEGRHGPTLALELIARATAHRGNALRVAGDLVAAAPPLERALHLAREISDPLARAEIYHLGAVLRRDQGCLPEALDLLERATALCRQVGNHDLVARLLLERAQLLRHQGRSAPAIEALRQSLELLDPHEAPQLSLLARHDLATFLVDAGRCLEAAELMAASSDLYAHSPDPGTNLKRRWLEAKIAHGCGETRVAEAAYRQAREGFREAGLAYEATRAGLDLARLYAEQGRAAELEKLADEMALFGALTQPSRDTLATPLLLREATARGEISPTEVQELILFLERSRFDDFPRLGDAPCYPTGGGG